MSQRESLRAATWLTSTLATAAFGGLALAADPPAPFTSAPEPPVSTKPIRGTINAPAGQWGRIEFVNVRTYPFDGRPGSALKRPPLGPTSRTIFQSPEVPIDSELPVGQLIHLEYQPTFATKMPPPGMPPHYHTFWEWGYTLKGDSIMPEPVSPMQKNGMLYRKKEGGWLTRPPYSLHGGSWVTGGGRNQLPYGSWLRPPPVTQLPPCREYGGRVSQPPSFLRYNMPFFCIGETGSGMIESPLSV